MKFKIYSTTPDGKTIFHIYDNLNQDIFTSEGILLNLRKDPRCENLREKPKKNTLSFKQKSKDLSDLRIQIGLNCNYHCKYCSQHIDRELTKKVIPIKLNFSEKINNFLSRLEKLKLSPKKITLWGGEPFVYFKQIKQLVTGLRKLYPEVRLGTCTNGSLLTKEVIDFCLDNKISITLSHDGPSFNVYRDDKNPLDNPEIIKNILYYIDTVEKNSELGLSFSLNIVITPENSNLLDIQKYFYEKFGREVRFHFESIVKLDSHSKGIISEFTEEQKKFLLNQLVAFGSTEDANHPFWSLRDRTSTILKRLVNKDNLLKKDFYCFIGGKTFAAVDLDGNLLTCHSSPAITSKYGELENLFTAVSDKYHKWYERKNCKNCPVAVSCMGGCTMYSDEDHEISCENLKLYHSGFFIAAWKLLFNSTITKIEPIGE